MCVGCNFPDSPLSVRELWRKYIQYISMKCTLSDNIKICMRFRNRWKSDYVRTLWQIVLKWAEPSVIPIVSRCTLPRPGYSLAGYYCLLYMIQISGACLTVIFYTRRIKQKHIRSTLLSIKCHDSKINCAYGLVTLDTNVSEEQNHTQIWFFL